MYRKSAWQLDKWFFWRLLDRIEEETSGSFLTKSCGRALPSVWCMIIQWWGTDRIGTKNNGEGKTKRDQGPTKKTKKNCWRLLYSLPLPFLSFPLRKHFSVLLIVLYTNTILIIMSWSIRGLWSEVGIYKRKQESKKTRKQELDQESD